MLMESQFWPPDQMLAYQRKQLTQLLHHARTQVPFYKTRLNPVFSRSGGIDWDRWHEIPIVTRADLRDNYDAMLANTLPPGHGPTKTFRSSGTSGVPIATEATRISSEAIRAAAARFYQNQKIDAQKITARFSNFAANGEALREEFHISKWQRNSAHSQSDIHEVVVNRNLSELRKLHLLQSFGVAYLHEITSNAEILATANLHCENPIKLEAVLCSGQTLAATKEICFKRVLARAASPFTSPRRAVLWAASVVMAQRTI